MEINPIPLGLFWPNIKGGNSIPPPPDFAFRELSV